MKLSSIEREKSPWYKRTLRAPILRHGQKSNIHPISTEQQRIKKEKKPKEINREEKPTRNIGSKKKKCMQQKCKQVTFHEMSSRNKTL